MLCGPQNSEWLYYFVEGEGLYIVQFIYIGLQPGDFVHVIGDTHVYRTHVKPLEEQIQKQPKPFPVMFLLLLLP
jgi:Thymidylate synthase